MWIDLRFQIINFGIQFSNSQFIHLFLLNITFTRSIQQERDNNILNGVEEIERHLGPEIKLLGFHEMKKINIEVTIPISCKDRLTCYQYNDNDEVEYLSILHIKLRNQQQQIDIDHGQLDAVLHQEIGEIHADICAFDKS